MSDAPPSKEGSSRIWTSKEGLVAATALAVAVVGGVGMWIFADRAGTLTEQVFADIEEVEIVEEIEVGRASDEAEKTPVESREAEPAPPESERLQADQYDRYRELYEDVFSNDPANLVHMTVDRPAYRPGQPVRWRMWVLAAGDLGEPNTSRGTRNNYRVELVDARGSVVADSTESITDDLIDGAFSIGGDASGGVWTLQVLDGGNDIVFERPLLVTSFEPPRFLQEVDFERDGYRQGEEVRAGVEVRRDTGEPVAEREIKGHVQVAGSHLTDLEISLDAAGTAEVSFDLPSVIDRDDAALALTVEEGGAVDSEVWPIPLALEDVEVTFHPEGGDLVEGLASRVYFEATDLSGEPIKLAGSVVDDAGGEVAQVETEQRGRGRFEFTPQDGREYHLEVSHPDVEADFALPEAEAEGCVMRWYDDFDSVEDSLRVALWCSEERKVGILGAMADEMFDAAAMLAGPEAPAVAHLKPEDGAWPRPAGVVRATAIQWDPDYEPEDPAHYDMALLEDKHRATVLADRVAFRGRRAQMDVDIELDRDVYHPGQELEMEITTRGPEGVTVDADVTLVAVDDRVHARADHLDVPSILGQLLLESDDLHFWADAEEVDDYFDLHEDYAEGLDLLMGARGWRSAEMREEYSIDGGDREAPKTIITRHRRERSTITLDSIEQVGVGGRPPESDRPRGVGEGQAVGADSAGPVMGLGDGSGDGGGAGSSVADDEMLGFDLSGDDPFGSGEPDDSPAQDSVVMTLGGGEGVGGGHTELVLEPEEPQPKRPEPRGDSLPPEPPQPAADDVHDEVSQVSVGEGYDGDESEPVEERSDLSDDPNEPELPRLWRDAEAVQFSAWGPKLSTGDDGRIAPVFELTEAVGAYRVIVEGVSEQGLLGRGEAVIVVEAPLSVATAFPETLSGGDAVALPVTVRNTHDEELDVQVDIAVQGAAQVGQGFEVFEVEVPARSTLTRYVPVTVEDRRGDVVVDVWAEGGGFIDGRRRIGSVQPRGVRRTLFASGTLPGTEAVELALEHMSDSGARARLAIYTGAASQVMEGVAEMDRRPLGSFEPLSARHHLNLLVWEYLARTGELDEKTRDRLHHRIVDGYRRMADYEVDGGGFEWFGGDEPQAHLTAWALVQFAAMEEVFGTVDPALVERSVVFLKSLARSDGSFDDELENTYVWQRMTDQRRRASELFAIYGLARAGLASEFEPQMEVARTTAADGDEVYEVALAAAAVAASGEESEALDAAMANLESLQRDDGSFVAERATQGWAGGYGRALTVETTGLAAMAIMEGGGDEGAVEAALAWLEHRRTGSGWWGSTQATAMALEALMVAEGDDSEFRDDVEVYVDGQSVAHTTVSSAELEPRVFADLGARLERESSQIEIRSDVALDYDLEVRWRQEESGNESEGEEADAPPLEFDVHVPNAADVTMGDEVSMELELENRREHGLGMVVTRLSVPGGLGVSDRELDALVERSSVEDYETLGREIRLYFDEFGAGESRSLQLSATADVPGAFEIPPSVAYPSYGDDSQWVWSDAGEMAVHLPRR